MIDTKLMNQATFDSQTGVATIGGGTLNAGVYEALSQNNATITDGRCPTVGAAGFLLGGGIGFNIRRLGIGCDALVTSQIVTADGDILTLSEKENPSLFLACRGGGGGNFGINTSFSVQTTPVPDLITGAQAGLDGPSGQRVPGPDGGSAGIADLSGHLDHSERGDAGTTGPRKGRNGLLRGPAGRNRSGVGDWCRCTRWRGQKNLRSRR